MGYTFKIGNMVPDPCDDIESFVVEDKILDTAPAFDGMYYPHQNKLGSSYSGWEEFCRRVGLYDFFYDYHGNLLVEHPGTMVINKSHVDFVSTKLSSHLVKSTQPQGFDDWYDSDLACLIWLEWWMKWALENCQNPAIENY